MNMNTPGRKTVSIGILALLVVGFLLTSGCVGVINPTPSEVMIRGNLISVDPAYVDGTFIWQLLLNPNAYEMEMFDAVDGYLVPGNPVIELGAGIGALSAYINDKITMPVNQVSVEPNPYLIPGLLITKKKNALGTTFVQKAIGYGVDTVEISVTSDITNNRIVESGDIVNSVDVETTTVQKLADAAGFSSDITLVMDIVGYEHSVVQYEADYLSAHVNTVIAAVYTDGRNTPDSFSAKMKLIGFAEKSRAAAEEGYTVMVFTK
ncbi:MAG: FkbM family methyltransferase [Methanocorpusculum sp.]|jgi:FkbM family methyltransferase|nr:FkbM family methyltransferase [Methanocorpusculum sp.]MDD3257136.1 FkbM family methyltransferase [Methanocorpusculum sp.]MDD4132512.1 FkbM family methyltransferase [Methanocorpusculum sp.]